MTEICLISPQTYGETSALNKAVTSIFHSKNFVVTLNAKVLQSIETQIIIAGSPLRRLAEANESSGSTFRIFVYPYPTHTSRSPKSHPQSIDAHLSSPFETSRNRVRRCCQNLIRNKCYAGEANCEQFSFQRKKMLNSNYGKPYRERISA
jgi:hypothetical protein